MKRLLKPDFFTASKFIMVLVALILASGEFLLYLTFFPAIMVLILDISQFSELNVL